MTRSSWERHEAASERLLQGFDDWARTELASRDARLALDYKMTMGEHRLAHWTHDDVDDLLLEYLPAQVALSPDEAPQTALTIGRFFQYLEATGRMARDSDPASDLIAQIDELMYDYLELMADPANAGPSKRLIMAMIADGVDVADGAQVEAWIEAFNAGTVEHRDAVLGFRGGYEEPHPIVLPRRFRMDEALALRSAEEAPILSSLRALAEYLGEGKRLTATGNLKLADARALVELLGTEDILDEKVGERVFTTRSAAQLIWLDMILWWARQVGVVKVRDRRMSMTKTWQKRAKDPLAAMREVVDVLFETGPLAMMGTRYYDEMDLVMDATAVALMAALYEVEQPLEDFIESMTRRMPEWAPLPDYYLRTPRGGEESYLKERVRFQTHRLIRLLEMAGLLTWNGGTLKSGRYGSRTLMVGGTLTITSFGEWVVQGYLTESGELIAPTLEHLTVDLDDEPEEIVMALAAIVPAGDQSLAQAWDALGGWDGLPDLLWRVDRPETQVLLEALGHALPDKATAKAARKALMRHRSWMASGG